jgi:hypothetical protein
MHLSGDQAGSTQGKVLKYHTKNKVHKIGNFFFISRGKVNNGKRYFRPLPIQQDDSDGKAIIRQADYVFRQGLRHSTKRIVQPD